jgi:hypothetical protein
VVLHVEGHGGAGVAGGTADLLRVVQRDLLAGVAERPQNLSFFLRSLISKK